MGNVRFAIVFLMLALVQGVAAIRAGVSGWWLGWIALSSMYVALSYALGKPLWFGKKTDGTLSTPLVLLNAPFLLLARAALTLRRWSSEPAWNEIVPGLYLGRRVLARELPPDVAVVVDLTAELSETSAVRSGRRYLLLPTLDGCAPELDALRRIVETIVSEQRPVFIHCAVGHGRSATVAAAVLLSRRLASSVEEAEAMLQRARPLVRLTASQRAVLQSFASGAVRDIA